MLFWEYSCRVSSCITSTMSTFRYNESLISLKWIERNEKSNQKNIYSHKNLQFKFEKFLTYISLTFSLHIHRKCTKTIYNFFLLKTSIKFLTIRANIHTKLIKTTLQQICTRYYYTRDQIPLPSWLKYFLTMGGPIISKSLIRIPLYIYIYTYITSYRFFSTQYSTTPRFRVEIHTSFNSWFSFFVWPGRSPNREKFRQFVRRGSSSVIESKHASSYEQHARASLLFTNHQHETI